MTVETIALVTFTFLCGGFIKGATGLGLPVVALSFMAAPLGVKAAIAITLGPSVITNIWQALAGPDLRGLVRRLWSYLLAAIVGVWFGAGILAASSPDLLLAILGSILCLYSAISLLSPQIPPPGERERYYSPVAGGLGGVMYGITGIFIVPGVLYLQALGLNRETMVQALGMSFVTISAALAVALTRHSLIPADLALLAIYAVLPTAAGLALGTRYRRRISEQQFRTLFFVSLFFVGIYMLARAVL